jgi:hypothetical protein
MKQIQTIEAERLGRFPYIEARPTRPTATGWMTFACVCLWLSFVAWAVS